MAIELATKYLPYVDEMFTGESKKALITNDDFDWSGAHSVKIYGACTSAMNDYGRSAPAAGNWSRYGVVAGLEATAYELTLSRDRSFTFAIDRLDEDETVGALQSAAALARQVREIVIPEVDSWILSKMSENAGTVEQAENMSSGNIYDLIIEAGKVLDDNLVPETGRCLIVSPAIYTLMKKSRDIVMETETGAEMRQKGVIATLDGAAVIKVPESRLPEKFGFMLVHPSATCAPVKLESYVIHDNPPGINGSLVEGRVNYDAFVLNNKKKGVYLLKTGE